MRIANGSTSGAGAMNPCEEKIRAASMPASASHCDISS
jgi:hypothetical protein